MLPAQWYILILLVFDADLAFTNTREYLFQYNIFSIHNSFEGRFRNKCR